MTIKILRRDIITASGAMQWLVRRSDTGEHYIVSGVTVPYTGWEVLVFPADSAGNVTRHDEVAGGRGITHEQAIAELEENDA